MKKKLLFVFIVVITSLSVFSQVEPRMSAAWQVKKYDITVSTVDRSLIAKATLKLQNVGNASGSRLTLRISPKAEVAAVNVNDTSANFTKGEEKLGPTTNLQRIFISLPSIQPLGFVTVTVDYKLKVDENSGLQAITPVGTQFLPQSFWYPTPNSWFAPKGGDFAPVNLKINSTETIISSQNANLSGQPFFLTGSWDAVESQGISVLLPKGANADERKRADELAAITMSAKSFVASLLGNSDTKFRLVAVRRGAGFSDSGTILLDYGAFRRQKVDAQTVMTIAESVAKNWIGNTKLVQDEGNGAIREGLSRFIANEFLEKQYGKAIADNERFRQRVSYANIAKNETPISIATPLDSSFYVVSANKGAILWRLLANQIGRETFFKNIREKNNLSLNEIREVFPNTTELLDYSLKNSNDTNLLVGLPQVNGTVTKVAVRNTGSLTVEIDVIAITENGQKLTEKIKLEQKSFGEVTFNTAAKIIRTEVDPDKIYPQIDYSDDVAPREFTESNPISSIKRAFDRQDFALAEKNARIALKYSPNLDEVRTWLGRSLLSQNKLSEAEKEFSSALSEKLPTPGTMAWANLGLAESLIKGEQKVNLSQFLDYSIISEGEYGANLSARLLRQKMNSLPQVDESVRLFFIDFDKAAASGRKSEVELNISSGEIVKFGSGVSAGQPEKWETKVIRTEKIDNNYAMAETTLTVKRLGVEALETGNAVFLLIRTGNRWKLSGIEIFEVR
jgi:tetratricopeptide (TPR) repeat protein